MLTKNSSKKDSPMAWMVCLTSAFFFFFDFVQLVIPNSLNTFLSKDLGIGENELSYLGIWFSLGNFLLLFPAVVAIDRYSLRRITLSMLTLSLLAALGTAQCESLWAIYGCRFLSGAAHAFCFLCCSTLVSRWFSPQKQGKVMGSVVAIGLLGALLGQAPLTALAEAFGWRNALLVNIGIGCISLGVAWYVIQDYPEDVVAPARTEGISFTNYALAYRNKKIWLYSLYIALINAPYMVIAILYLNNFLEVAHGIDAKIVSYVSTYFFAGNIVGNPVWGMVSEKAQSHKKPMLWGAVLCLCTLLAFLYIPMSYAIIAGVACFILGFLISVQVLAYPAIIESASAHLVTASLSIASFVVMGSIPVLQKGTAMLLDSIHQGAGGAPDAKVYATTTYTQGFLPMVGALVLGIGIALIMEETYRPKAENKQ